jgi:hypothetical protein
MVTQAFAWTLLHLGLNTQPDSDRQAASELHVQHRTQYLQQQKQHLVMLCLRHLCCHCAKDFSHLHPFPHLVVLEVVVQVREQVVVWIEYKLLKGGGVGAPTDTGSVATATSCQPASNGRVLASCTGGSTKEERVIVQ